jgi:hypothetical protein
MKTSKTLMQQTFTNSFSSVRRQTSRCQNAPFIGVIGFVANTSLSLSAFPRALALLWRRSCFGTFISRKEKKTKVKYTTSLNMLLTIQTKYKKRRRTGYFF